MNQSGQTLVEYVLMIALVVVLSQVLMPFLPQQFGKIERFVQDRYRASYRYGHPEAKGWDDGGPKNHPRASVAGNNNFRIFRRSQ